MMGTKKHKMIFKIIAIVSGIALLVGAFLPFLTYLK